VIVYFPFTGFEICAIPAEETKGGEKTVFRSMKNISLIGSIGSSVLANSPAPLATASALISKESQSITAMIGMIAMLSAVNAYMIAGSRVLQNISSIFNLRLLRELASSGTPKIATIVVTFADCILLLFSSHFEELASISVVATLLPYVFVCLSAYKVFFDDNKTRFIACIGALSTSAIFAIYFILHGV
jgi:amino acid transporter